MFDEYAMKALYFGLLSAASLPLGAIIAFYWTPGQKTTAVLMAFGGGALLAALTIDIVAHQLHQENFDFLPLGCGVIAGGLLFDFLNSLVNSKGGFLRKFSTTLNHLKGQKLKEYRELFETFSRIPFFHQLPAEEIRALLPHIQSCTIKNSNNIVKQGEDGDSMFIIESGEVDILDEKNNNRRIARLTRDEIFGEMSLLTGEPRAATAFAVADTKVWTIHKDDFDAVLLKAPKLAEAVERLVKSRIQDLEQRSSIPHDQAQEWYERASRDLSEEQLSPTEAEIKEAAAEHGGAPLAIWLGILLDGIPESLVIGASLIPPAAAATAAGALAANGHGAEAAAVATISFSLIAGLFLSNFPEALSSSAGMLKHGYSKTKIFIMWFSLCILTGIGALLGNVFLEGAPEQLLPVIEGLAAGAMLTMIAETMLPEAYQKGGSISGMSTTLGFLAAIFFKTLE